MYKNFKSIVRSNRTVLRQPFELAANLKVQCTDTSDTTVALNMENESMVGAINDFKQSQNWSRFVSSSIKIQT